MQRTSPKTKTWGQSPGFHSQQYDEPELPGRLPRITHLMALAIRCDELLRTGKVRDLETIGHVSQPRISQILSLTMLAPRYPGNVPLPAPTVRRQAIDL